MAAMATAAATVSATRLTDPMFPVETRTCVAEVNGHPTDFVVSVFGDTVLVLITQNSKLASWFYACSETAAVGIAPGSSVDDEFAQASYTTETLLGRRDDSMLQVLARQLIQRVAVQWPGKCLVLSVTLAQPKASPQHIKAILQLLHDQQLISAEQQQQPQRHPE